MLFCYIFHRCLCTFPNEDAETCCVRFNGSGSRLLCYEAGSRLIVYDLSTKEQLAGTGKMKLKAADFINENILSHICCFAGMDDEMVISGSDNDNLYIWSLPDPKGQDCQVNRPLRVLTGHQDTINCVRYSSEKSAFISSDYAGVIKLWTSGVSIRKPKN